MEKLSLFSWLCKLYPLVYKHFGYWLNNQKKYLIMGEPNIHTLFLFMNETGYVAYNIKTQQDLEIILNLYELDLKIKTNQIRPVVERSGDL